MIEYRIRRGSGTCEYSSEESPVLIQLVDANGTPSGWMGASALNEAMGLLNALAGISTQQRAQPAPQSVFQQVMTTPQRVVAENEPAPVQAPRKQTMTPAEAISLEAFKEACNQLNANPPPNRKGEIDGVPESAIRELIQRWRGRFQRPMVMGNALREVFGVSPDRLEFLLG